MYLKKIIPILIAFFALPILANAQVTTSSISGIAKSTAGNTLQGASITATHTPTGTVYTTVARNGGRFDINNMNPGGPYLVVVSFSGFESYKRDDVFLILGESQNLSVDLKSKTTDLDAVVVTTTKTTTAKTGTETSINRAKIDIMPTVGRNLGDFIRFTPQAKVNGQSISIGGQNNRYNSFLIDGAVNNDVFGLSASGTNGGQAGTPPISIDAIDQIVVQISPYDAAQGNFTGGSINAITKSGTNNFHGSLYYVFRNQNLAGKTPTWGLGTAPRISYPDFDNKTYGFTIGGPIMKNKAFFFLNAEQQRDSRPQPYTGPLSITDSVNKVINILKTNYGYDPGDWINNVDKIDRTNVNTRFDFNLNSKNKLTASYRYTKAERVNANRSSYNGSTGSIAFSNGAQFFPSITHSGNIELNSKFTNKVNNKIRVSVTDVNDDRGFVGTPFPSISLSSYLGGPSYTIGSEAASSANILKQNIINIFDAFKINAGKNSFTLGADIDLNKSYNLFINRNFGVYTYSALGPNVPLASQIGPIEAFRLGKTPSGYRRAYSLVDGGNKGGDANVNAAANFKSVRLGFFINDDIKVNQDLTITVGLRADKTSFTTAAPVDKFFNDTARLVIANAYDLKGAVSGERFKPNWIFSPRLGFKYKMDDQGVTLRGGVGIFAGRTPLVWPGGIYANTGNLIGEVNVSVGTAVGAITPYSNGGLFNTNYNGGLTTSTGVAVPFRPDVNNQFTQADFGLPANLLTPQGDLNLVAKDFKLPAVWKASLAADKKLGSGWTLTTELNFSKNINEVDWQNVNYAPNSGIRLAGPDNREVNNVANNANPTTRFVYRPYSSVATVRNPYSNIILIKNSEGSKGYAYNFTVSIEKQAKNGLQFNAAYTYGNSVARNEATSSVNTSNWSFMETVSGRNNLTRTTSDFDLGHRIYALVSKKFTYANKHAATTITFSYNGQSGNPYSYVYSGNLVGDGVSGNDLMYVPKDRAEMDLMTFVNTNATVNGVSVVVAPTQQKDDLEAFIQGDKYLSKRRGQYAERNGARLPFTNILDFSIAQDFMIKAGKTTHKLTIGLDMFNFTNLLNINAGRQFFLSNDQSALVSFRGYTGGNTPTFSFNKPANDRAYNINDVQTSANTSSRWNGQATIRYSF